MSYINELRALGDFDGTTSYYSERDERLDILEGLDFKKYGGCTIETVDTDFEDLGRWSNYETEVLKLTDEDGNVAYFEYGREVPATESQDGMDCSFHFREVKPVEVTVIKYV